MLKQSIAGFHDLSKHQCFDSLLFKSLDSSYIVQYFLVEKKEYEYSAFGFIANSSVLLELPIIGMGASEYKVFKTYYDNLKGCKK